ncbi:MAG: NAD-dependent epimerase/dehydratase family protein [Acidobacteriota bacterium]|nr:NAD-dependent epimerase/dehydratase family protein [Acidobacteriota bacterium]
MLRHAHASAVAPARVVVVGSGGFIGGAILRRVEADGVPTLPLTRAEVDLTAPEAGARLASMLQADDTLVFVSANAPCKDLGMLRENVVMAEAVCEALQRRPVVHAIYVSSDAVYADSPQPLTEHSAAEPGSLHGAMHLTREIAMRGAHAGPLAIVRPTLVYGADDPHNGYGPNRFRRLASAGEEIVLFGEGEERRDHVDVDDVAELVRLIAVHRSAGVANAVSGQVASFRELAELAAASFTPRVAVRGTPRAGEMPHGGFRPFDNRAVLEAFPGFVFKGWREGLGRLHALTRDGGAGGTR